MLHFSLPWCLLWNYIYTECCSFLIPLPLNQNLPQLSFWSVCDYCAISVYFHSGGHEAIESWTQDLEWRHCSDFSHWLGIDINKHTRNAVHFLSFFHQEQLESLFWLVSCYALSVCFPAVGCGLSEVTHGTFHLCENLSACCSDAHWQVCSLCHEQESILATRFTIQRIGQPATTPPPSF